MTGEHSQFPIMRLAAKYNQMQKDGPLLSTRHSIAIVRERISQLAERIDLNEAPDRLARIVEAWHKYTGELDSGKTVEAMLTREKIDHEIEAAYHDYAAWKQMFEALDLDRKMVESEVKIIKDIGAIMTAETAREFQAKLLAAVLRVEKDPKKLRQIQYEFAKITGDRADDSDDESGTPDGEDAWGSGGDIIDAE